MFGVAGAVARWGATFLFRFVGGHLIQNHLAGPGRGGALQVIQAS